jgi:type I restriction enzyme, S subunit
VDVKPGYKQTEVGVIPEDWGTPLLGTHFSFKNGLNKGKKFFGHGTPIVNYMDVYGHTGIRAGDLRGLVEVSKQELESFRVKRGDVFFTRTSETVEEVGIASVLLDDSPDTVFSGFILRARPKDGALIDQFKKYCFSSSGVRKQITSKSSYTTRALTNGRFLSGVVLPLPPTKAEQEAIAEALSDADAYIASLEQLIAKKRHLKQGAMQDLLTGKKRLPGFSAGWKQKRLGAIAHIKTGGRNNQDKVEDGEYPFFVRSATVERINSYSYDCEAILVPGEGGIGSIFHYVTGRFDVHQRVYVISQFSQETSGKYTYYYMVERFGVHAMQNSVKATVDSLRLPTFQNFEIAVPPTREEQIAIAEILSEMDTDITALEAKLAKTRQLKQGMMQELLTGKTRLI